MEPSTPQNVFTPSQLNTLARDMLEGAFPSIWVEGELGNVARPSSGHLYFNLKDARAQVRCAMFKPKSTWLRFQPREGLRVLARGRATLYEARGEYQLVLDHMEEAGEGALRRAFDELKARLAAEGVFDDARKRPLPAYARRIGVITSPTGAAIRDVLSVFARRFPLVEVDVLPVPVQGAAAAAQITSMLQSADASGRYDVLLLTRGGGSLEDLWSFNDEHLTRAVAASGTPVVCAVGHETDFSLAEFAADLRAPTPSVAAELVVPSTDDLARQLRALASRLRATQLQRLRQAMQRTDRASLRLNALRPQARVELLRRRQAEALRRLESAWHRRLDRERARVRHADAVLRAHHPQRRLARLRERLAAIGHRPQSAMARRLSNDAMRLRGLVRSLAAVSPIATLARGYAIVRDADGGVVRSASDTQPGAALDVHLSDGGLHVRVIETRSPPADDSTP
ncbi:exodeoxyribonuclease VII large subunit [Cognatilysobacter bugurensis]|uniref:Exodeoxyribonuclease 7 large subunit n=1 Tax=Cognatilysobacter bugurensis TaxID=543356 RepID=A0A918STJ9_9GAMM|nr:exodeoxyribonuclease VII large subunit [Lysobacter bugurensis]GHA70110.1 exodeoxyribonuclease 7 large subunit [Lysobacter bugurensis]